MRRTTIPFRVQAAVLAAILAVVSWHTAWNLGGAGAAVGYALACAVVMLLVRPVATRFVPRGPAWLLPTAVAAVGAALVATFVLGFPAALGDAMGVGSDRADALDVALSRLAHGLYPYDGVTYLGNPITPLPGALLMAAPFVRLTGHAAWQNVAWLVLLLPVLNRGVRLRPEPTLLWGLDRPRGTGGRSASSPIGDDLVTGAVPALVAAAWTLSVARVPSPATVVAAGAALGLASCTRPHLALVVVVVAAAVGVTAGWRRAVAVGVSASVVWVLLIVPFLVGGSARFSPLHVAAKITGDRSVTPGIVVVGLVAVVLLVVALAVVRPSSACGVGWFCAAVLFAPSVLSLARRFLGGPAADLDLTLGAAAVPFALWAISARPSAVAQPGPDLRALEHATATTGSARPRAVAS